MSRTLAASLPEPAALPMLAAGRVHEVYGPGAMGFAVAICARTPGRWLWIREGWQPGTLDPQGLAARIDPARLLLARTAGQTDSLAVAEEALKDGAFALVLVETTRPLDLREGRRLQLAAQAGRATGLCLIPEGMGAASAETRWQVSPVFEAEVPGAGGGDSTLMRWELIKNKRGTLGVWHVRWNRAAHRLDLVSAPGGGPGAAPHPAR